MTKQARARPTGGDDLSHTEMDSSGKDIALQILTLSPVIKESHGSHQSQSAKYFSFLIIKPLFDIRDRGQALTRGQEKN